MATIFREGYIHPTALMSTLLGFHKLSAVLTGTAGPGAVIPLFVDGIIDPVMSDLLYFGKKRSQPLQPRRSRSLDVDSKIGGDNP